MYEDIEITTKNNIMSTSIKISNIYKKYKPDESLSVIDLEDVRRLSEILYNLSKFMDTLTWYDM